MTGNHEVRDSIPLGSTNNINKLGHPTRMPLVVLGLPLGAKGVDFHAQAKIEHLAVIA